MPSKKHRRGIEETKKEKAERIQKDVDNDTGGKKKGVKSDKDNNAPNQKRWGGNR